MKLNWHTGNQLRLLVNGEAFYPEVLAAVAAAREEILIETFILFEDPVGHVLRAALMDAARRGVRVSLTVDGYGSPEFSKDFVRGLTEAGVQVHVFDPQPRVLGMRLHLIHRLHRKIVVIDQQLAFMGGINYSEDHLYQFGPESKQDYALRIEGPVVADIHADALNTLAPVLRRRGWRHWLTRLGSGLAQRSSARHVPPSGAQPNVAAFVKRDNAHHRKDIERCYRLAIRAARDEVLIANAYFFPGYRLLRDLRHAARRGVKVQLILQGRPDMGYVRTAARLLYRALVKDGVQIHEYCHRPLHGKVAVIDGHWVTVGSSNLDPLSLSLNLEANIVALDTGLAQALRADLQQLQRDHCTAVPASHLVRPNMWRYWLSAIGFHASRLVPQWLARLQHSEIRLRTFVADQVIDSAAPPELDLGAVQDAPGRAGRQPPAATASHGPATVPAPAAPHVANQASHHVA